MKANRLPWFISGGSGFLASCLVLFALAGPVEARPLDTLPKPTVRANFPATPLFAGLGAYFSDLATRHRVVQVCVVTMCLALLIIMKKFSSEPWTNWPRRLRAFPDPTGHRGTAIPHSPNTVPPREATSRTQ